MEQIQQILSAPQSSSGATSLIKLYKEITGESIKVGCLCKASNVNNVYKKVEQWYTANNN